MNEDTWENLDTTETKRSRADKRILNDAPVRFGERELKAENEQVWIDGFQIGERTSHNQKQLWEDGLELEPWISVRTYKIWR